MRWITACRHGGGGGDDEIVYDGSTSLLTDESNYQVWEGGGRLLHPLAVIVDIDLFV